jgi:glycosyltransferase involved in cell wall biosynthesis
VEVVRVVPFAPRIGEKWKHYASIPAYEEVEGIPVRTIRAIVPPRMIAMEYLPNLVHRALQREIARFKPDVLNASFIIPCGQIAVRQRVPTVVTAHGGDAYAWPFQRPGLLRAAQEAIRNATRVTAVSDYIRRCVERIAPREVDVILNGADDRYFFPRDRDECREALSLPRDRFIIAFAGNVLRAKGLFDLVESLRGFEPQPLVVLAGNGGDRDALQAATREAGVDMRFLGRRDSADVAKLFAAADVVTLPSHNEGLPNVVCEAMLSERTVVATTVGGTAEILDESRGILVPPHDPAALRAAFERLARDGALRDRLARAARAFARERLTWKISAQQYERVYRLAANGR